MNNQTATLDEYQTLLETKEELHEDLAMYVELGGVVPMIRHPLVYCMFYTEAQNALLNRRYAMLKEATEKALDAGDYSGFLVLHEKPYRLDAFLSDVRMKVDRPAYWRHLGELYTSCENIYQQYSDWEDALFYPKYTLDRESFMQEKNLKLFKKLPKIVTVYRGTRCTNWQGFSWTTDIEKAKWFAKRYKDAGHVTEGRVLKENVLGYFAGRGESEVVCHPMDIDFVKQEAV